MTDKGLIREGYGEGYDERGAMQNWLSSEQFDDYGIGKGYAALDTSTPVISKCIRKPKIAKRAHVIRVKQVGSRKWETVYQLWTDDMCWAQFDTQADAIERAKEISLEKKIRVCVNVAKHLVEQSTLTADVTPGNSQPGQWHFSAMFKW